MSSQHKRNFRYELVTFAEEYGIRRASSEYRTTVKTVRLWVKRYRKQGIKGLDEL